MADSLESVNAAVRLYRKWAADGPNNAISVATIERWRQIADGMASAIEELTALRAWARPVPAAYGDVSDLPPELLAQLSGVKTDELEDQIYAIAKAAGDSIDLDKMLIELYRRSGEVHQRKFLMNKCYRMIQKGLIFAVPARKGVYTIHSIASPDITKPKAEATRETFNADMDDEIPF